MTSSFKMMGRLEILELLLMHGAEIRLVDSKGGTCLHSSVFGGSTEALAYLLDNGADVLIDEPDQVQHREVSSYLSLCAYSSSNS